MERGRREPSGMRARQLAARAWALGRSPGEGALWPLAQARGDGAGLRACWCIGGRDRPPLAPISLERGVRGVEGRIGEAKGLGGRASLLVSIP